jgi:TolB-like protein/DNA-binding winged helix-turn-helix (wHTH) protein/Flp pilus assembly protein TadD
MPQSAIRFAEFELDPDRCQLRRQGRNQKLERIPMELLTLLVENQGRVVSRQAIVERLWGKDVFLETDHSINTAINKIRRVLRDDPENPRFVQTVFGKGYRFLAETSAVEEFQTSAPTPVRDQAVSDSLRADLQPPVARVSTENTPPVADASGPAGSGPPASPPESREPRLEEQTAPKLPKETGKARTAPRQSLSLLAPDAKTPTNRSLRVLAWSSIVLISAAALIYGTVQLAKHSNGGSAPSVAPAVHSIAVLPMVNLSGDPGQEYLVDGMTDQLITDLARATSLRVISRTSTMQYKGAHTALREIVRALNVDTIVEGSILPAQGNVRITAQLIDGRTDHHLWAQSYERSSSDLLAMQDEVAQDIVHQIAATLQPVRRGGVGKDVKFEAYDQYLHGRYFWNRRTLKDLEKSIDYYEQAIKLAPNFAPAYAALGDSYAVITYRGGPPPSQTYPRARDAADKALALDDSLAEAHALLGEVRVNYDWDWPGGEKEFQRAVELNPNYPTAHHWYAIHLALMGRRREAQAEIDKAYSLDPLSLVINETRGQILYWTRDMDRAGEVLRYALELDSRFPDTYATRGEIYEQTKRFPEALGSFQQAVDLSGSNPKMLLLQAHALALSGKKDAAKAAVQRLVSSKQSYLAGTDVAAVYCALGETHLATSWLQKAYESHEEGMTQLAMDPLFDGCRPDSQFQSFVRRLNLPQ